MIKKLTNFFYGAVLFSSSMLPAQSLFKDLIPGAHPASSNTEQYKNVGSDMFFLSRVPSGTKKNDQLWKTDGTIGGTVRVLDSIHVSNASGLVILVGDLNGELMFFKRSTTNSTSPFQLWKSDGTTSGTVMIKQFGSNPLGTAGDPKNYTFVGNKLFFTVADAAGRELWVSDGTASGTNMVIDLAPGNIAPGAPYSGALNAPMVAYNGKVYFAGSTTGSDEELYSSDGTAVGTTLVYQYPGVPGCDPDHFKVWNGDLYFGGNSSTGNSHHLFKTDGTTTSQITSTVNMSYPIVFNNQLFFISGFDLWKSDGTVSGTTFITANISNSGYAGANNDYFFTKLSTTIYRTDGTAAGTSIAAGDFGASASFNVINNIMYKTHYDSGSTTLVGLWQSDGTSAGTVKIHYGTATGFEHVYNGKIWFSEYDATNGTELWSFDPNSVTGIPEMVYSSRLTVYPNPASESLKIKSDLSSEAIFEVYDILGNEVLKQQNLQELDLSHYEKGVYFIKVTDKETSLTKTFMVR
ncbi:MAG: T9SS type A sorting domain-containing protein [Bacteroidota bacterium]